MLLRLTLACQAVLYGAQAGEDQQGAQAGEGREESAQMAWAWPLGATRTRHRMAAWAAVESTLTAVSTSSGRGTWTMTKRKTAGEPLLVLSRGGFAFFLELDSTVQSRAYVGTIGSPKPCLFVPHLPFAHDLLTPSNHLPPLSTHESVHSPVAAIRRRRCGTKDEPTNGTLCRTTMSGQFLVG